MDRLLGNLIEEVKAAKAWDSTYVIVTADHGMGMTKQSNHNPSTASSWKPYMNFYGPGIKRGETIPYAESPDVALMIAHILGLGPLRGHTDPQVSIEPKGATGTLLANIFKGNPREIAHPMFIRRYLESVNWQASNNYAEYRLVMIKCLTELKGQH